MALPFLSLFNMMSCKDGSACFLLVLCKKVEKGGLSELFVGSKLQTVYGEAQLQDNVAADIQKMGI